MDNVSHLLLSHLLFVSAIQKESDKVYQKGQTVGIFYVHFCPIRKETVNILTLGGKENILPVHPCTDEAIFKLFSSLQR